METGNFSNEAIQLYRASDRWADLYVDKMVTFTTFQNVPVSIQLVRTPLFVNQILQVWYQNAEDIHLFPMKCI